MSRTRPNFYIVVSLVAAVGGALLIAHLVTKPSRRAAQTDSDGIAAAAPPLQAAEAQGFGRVRPAITVPPEAGLTSVSYAVISAEHVVVARGSSPVDKQTGVAAPPALAVPSGKRYTLSVVGNGEVEGVKRATYLGTSGFDVSPGRETPVNFTPNAVETAAGESAGAATAGGAAATVDNATACQNCELSSGQGICSSANITATSNTDPQTGDQTGVGWGCETLADSKARSVCLALLHCLNVNDCSRPGENPVGGCYCGVAVPQECIGGQGINGACIAEYQAAALASPAGPSSGAGSGQLSQFVATASSDPTTPIGLANNIKHCATETHCAACQTL